MSKFHPLIGQLAEENTPLNGTPARVVGAAGFHRPETIGTNTRPEGATAAADPVAQPSGRTLIGTTWDENGDAYPSEERSENAREPAKPAPPKLRSLLAAVLRAVADALDV